MKGFHVHRKDTTAYTLVDCLPKGLLKFGDVQDAWAWIMRSLFNNVFLGPSGVSVLHRVAANSKLTQVLGEFVDRLLMYPKQFTPGMFFIVFFSFFYSFMSFFLLLP